MRLAGVRLLLLRSLRPATLRAASVLAVLAFVGVWLLLFGETRSGESFRVDEAHKVSETVALRLVLEGRWSDPLWFRERVDRTNPPFGKYVFGAAVLLSGGTLPREPSLSRLAAQGHPPGLMPPQAPASESAPYLPLLAACRRASLFATAITAALVAFLAARLHGAAAALIGVTWFAQHWMTFGFGPTAIFDALLACLIFATGALLFAVAAEPRRAVSWAPLIGLLSAAAFQTRLNGGMAFGGALLVFAIVALRTRSARVIGGTLLMTAIFITASVAMNPYYWADAPDGAEIPARLRADVSLVPRVINRLTMQVEELGAILKLVTAEGVRLPLWAAQSRERAPIDWTIFARLRFFSIAVAGGVAGTLMLVASLCGCVMALRRGDAAAVLAVWAMAITTVTLLWLPVPWARYLSPLLPIMALFGATGIATLLQRLLGNEAAGASGG